MSWDSAAHSIQSTYTSLPPSEHLPAWEALFSFLKKMSATKGTAPTSEPVAQATKQLQEVDLEGAASVETRGAEGAEEDTGEGIEEAADGESKKKKKSKSGAARKKNKKLVKGQTEPPTVPVSKMFGANSFPEGEVQEYDTSKFLDENRVRVTQAELKERERLAQEEPHSNYNFIRQAAEVHRQVRQYAQRTIRPGMSMIDIANIVEDGTRNLVQAEGFERGIGFPTGLSINECAAHYTPNGGDKRGTLLQYRTPYTVPECGRPKCAGERPIC